MKTTSTLRKATFLFAFLFCLTTGFSQIFNPVSWQFKTERISDTIAELQLIATIEKDWHIYSQVEVPDGPLPTLITFNPSKGYKLIGKTKESKPIEEYDDAFETNIKYFSGKAVFKQRIQITSKDPVKITGVVDYQACIGGKCTQSDADFTFNLDGAKTISLAAEVPKDETVSKETDSAAVSLKAKDSTPVAKDTMTFATADASNKAKEGKSLWLVFMVAFGMGLLALITPCVFPMIPMTISFFMKSGGNRKKGIRQAWIFGISIILIFAVLGLILTLIFGKDAMYTLSTHWIPNLIFFAIFMLFAFSFFGLFEITLPSWMINKSDQEADKGGIMAPFFIALTTVLVSFSCTGPILGGALIELSSGSTNRLIPLISMLGFAFGFALPFTLLAMFPSVLSKLKSGSWLNTVKIVFGFLEVALGLKFLSMADLGANWGILDRETYLALWIVVFALLGFYLLGKLRFKGDSEVSQISVPRLFLSMITFAFVVYMIPGLWGAPLKALSGYVPPMTTQDFDLDRIIYEYTSKSGGGGSNTKTEAFAPKKHADQLHLPTGFSGFFDLEEAKAYAKKVNKPIFVDFTGKTCANCREMENNVWNKPEVKSILNDKYVMVALYADANFIDLPESEWVTTSGGKVIKTLGKKNLNYQITRFNMNAQPYYVLMDANENVLTKENKVYDRNVENFVKFLTEGLENFAKQNKK